MKGSWIAASVLLVLGNSLQAQQNLTPPVGIGTTSPQRILHVSSSTSDVEPIFEKVGDGFSGLLLKSNNKIWQWSKRPSSEGDALQLYHHNSVNWLSAFMTVRTNGNIGLGDSYPIAKLHVAGDRRNNTLILSGTEPGVYFVSGTTKWNALLSPDYKGYGIFEENDGSVGYRFFVKEGGNVSIGGTNPNYKLEVTNNSLGTIENDRTNLVMLKTFIGLSNAELRFESIRHTSGQTWQTASSRIQQSIDNVGMGYIEFGPKGFSKGMVLGSNNIGRVFISDDGQVGIGTIKIADPQFNLFVEKGIRTRKVKVDVQSWPDYVFSKNYELRSLQKLEQFITKHGHLPGFASESEVKTTGIDLADTQAKLLEKIEELTLYVIELNKKLALQQQEIEGMRHRFNANASNGTE